MMLPGYDVCSRCDGTGMADNAWMKPRADAYEEWSCVVCSGVGSVPADATVEALARGLHLANTIPSDGPQFWHTEARAALVAYAQTVKEN